MLIVETIRNIRLSVKRDGKSIRQTARDLNLSRNTIRKVIRSDQTLFEYKRHIQYRPKLGGFVEALNKRLTEDNKLPKRRRRTARKLYQELQQEGYDGGYDSVRRYIQQWRKDNTEATGHVFIPLACTPGAGWEKGQIESQVKTVRRNFFTPQVRVRDFAELNACLKTFCIGWAKTHRHPEIAGQTVFEVFEAEKSYLLRLPPLFDGYAEKPSRVSPSSLISFDRNRYSVDCRHVGRTVQLRVYADRIVIVKDGQVVGDHKREFGRDKTVFNPWHYLAALAVKPGALRNGAPFKDWDLPGSIRQIHDRLKQRYTDWDRQFVGILAAVPLYGFEAVEKACQQALNDRSVSKEVVLNLLHRSRDQKIDVLLDPSTCLFLKNEPIADRQRYDYLLKEVYHVAQ